MSRDELALRLALFRRRAAVLAMLRDCENQQRILEAELAEIDARLAHAPEHGEVAA